MTLRNAQLSKMSKMLGILKAVESQFMKHIVLGT